MLLVACVTFIACSSDHGTETERLGSTREPLVVATGIDYSFARPSADGISNEGYTFVARYLSPPPNGKNLSKSEVDALWAAKVDVAVVFEEGAMNVLGGHAQGVTDAQIAESQSAADGMPAGRPIYFAVDFDAQPSDFAAIDAYFDGVASVIGVSRAGVYGGYSVVSHLFDVAKIEWGWQTYAWSAGSWDARAHLRQVQNDITAAGDSNCCDADQAMAHDYGQWHAGPVDPCDGVSVDGAYCGASPQFAGGTKGHLYKCAGGTTASDTACAAGCTVEPAGTADKCAPSPDGGASDAAPSVGKPGTVPDNDERAHDADAGNGPGEEGTTQPSGGCTAAAAPSGAASMTGLGGAWIAIGLVVTRRRRRSAGRPETPG